MAKYHTAELAERRLFDSFDIATNEGGAGIDFCYATKTEGTRVAQAILFDAENITAEAALAWLNKRNVTAIEFATDVGDDVKDDESDEDSGKVKAGQAPADDAEIIEFDPSQDRDNSGQFAGSKTVSRSAEEASERAAGGKGTHKAAQHAHYAARDAHASESKRRAAEGDTAGAAKSKTMAAYHADQAETHRKESWKHEGNALGGRLSLGKAAGAAGAGALIGLAIRTIAGKAPEQPGDIKAYNFNHEGGTGRFAHGSGGAKKLHDAGANAASEVAHAASKSASAFTGSHAAAASARREAAAVASKVHERSKSEFQAALGRKDQLGAVVHSTEALNAENNRSMHERTAMEHENRAQAEAEHATRTGLALDHATHSKIKTDLENASRDLDAARHIANGNTNGKNRGSLIGRLVGGLARGAGKATVAVVKAPFQVAGWAIGKGVAAHKARATSRAEEAAKQSAKQASEAASATAKQAGEAAGAVTMDPGNWTRK